MVDLLLIARLRRYLKRKLHMKVDVIPKDFLNDIIKEEVLEHAVPRLNPVFDACFYIEFIATFMPAFAP